MRLRNRSASTHVFAISSLLMGSHVSKSPLNLAHYRQPLSLRQPLGDELTVLFLPSVRGVGILDCQQLCHMALVVYLCFPFLLIAPYRQLFSQLHSLGGDHIAPSHLTAPGLGLLGGQPLFHLVLLVWLCSPLVRGFDLRGGQRLCHLFLVV